VFGQLATELHPELKKGTEVYCEGRLRLDSWTGRDSRERSGLSVAAARVEVLGRIGYDPHPCKPTETEAPLKQPEFEGHGRNTMEDLPF
jgi:single-stranded DNA-binding protein